MPSIPSIKIKRMNVMIPSLQFFCLFVFFFYLNALDPVAVLPCKGRGPFLGGHEEWWLQGRTYCNLSTKTMIIRLTMMSYTFLCFPFWPCSFYLRSWMRSSDWINVPHLSWLNNTIWRRFPTRCISTQWCKMQMDVFVSRVKKYFIVPTDMRNQN